jgi:hypothetical protein
MEALMAVIIQRIESAPEGDYPLPPVGTPASLTLGQKSSIWQRLENYTAYRFSERAVVWVVEGPGEFKPNLAPATISTVEVWSRGANVWETATLDASPLGGYFLNCTGPYKFTGTAGVDDTVPDDTVLEAYRRLANYFAANPGKAGARSESITAGSISTSHTRSESWMANAMANSGAGDLLRSYRRV